MKNKYFLYLFIVLMTILVILLYTLEIPAPIITVNENYPLNIQ